MSSEVSAQRNTGIALLVGGAISTQLGAACATMLMPLLGLWAVLLCRYVVMALMHCTLSLRYWQDIQWRRAWWALVVAVPLLGMNIAIYLAFQRIGIGLAVTIELTGPILLAIVASRSWLVASLSGVTFVGLLLITGPSLEGNIVGVACALLAAALWAIYLVAAKSAASRLPGLVPLALASLCALVVLVPLNAAALDLSAVSWREVLLGIAAGLFSSALPYAADLLALRRLAVNVASNLMSLHPVAAVIFGAALLGERMGLTELVGLTLICVSNVAVVSYSERRKREARETVGIPVLDAESGYDADSPPVPYAAGSAAYDTDMTALGAEFPILDGPGDSLTRDRAVN